MVDFPIPKMSLSEQWDYVNEVQDMIRQREDAERQEAETVDQAVAALNQSYESDHAPAKPKIYDADYKGAPPRQVAAALLNYRRR